MSDDFLDKIEQWRDAVVGDGRKPYAQIRDALTDDQERDMLSARINVWVDEDGAVHASRGGHHSIARTPRRAIELLPGVGD